MTPEQALQILAELAALAPVPLAAHQQANQAYQVLHQAITADPPTVQEDNPS